MRPLIAALVAAGAVVVPRAARAAEYWVATTGNNTNSGSSTAPWATLQYAAGRVNAGDTVHVVAGNFVGFHLTRGGTATSPVRFVAEGVVNITARNATTPDGINVEGADYVTIEGFVVNGMPRAGVRCALSRFVTIRKISADANSRWGIFTGCCPDVTIEDSVLSRSAIEHGIYVSNSADRPIIRRNRSFSNNANGIHMNGDASISCGALATQDGVISNAVVERNVIYDNGAAGGSGINCDGVQSSLIANNLIYATRASGISLYRIDGGAGARNNRVINNTVIVASTGRWGLNIRDASTGNTIRNNIFFTYHSFRGAISVTSDSRSGFTSDYNIFTPRFTTDDGTTVLTLAQWQALGYDGNSVASTPAAVFVDSTTNDYHLRLGSPAIDKGELTSAPSVDLEGATRPMGAGVDIGAYERAVAPVDAGPADVGTDTSMPDTSVAPDTSIAPDTAMADSAVTDSATDDTATSPDDTGNASVDSSTDTSSPLPLTDTGVEETEATSTGDDGGCGCRLPASGRRDGTWSIALVAAAWLLSRRRAR